ncbi:substrate-binding family protein [Roseivirga ehrenbergii]|uniref:Leucine-binding protein domain-containing protein n=1 Tax=Roseivirga ehrenbergii (strain DSM 102268 / JCM 13514 / KCTC 12282 / NCIMB 14502 / KMM 6017) TaxID=279360 RepID=A0A150XJ04_ROSEK|nr:ABC transporter substrate-binding protein [Roseivirga ehrenbergii]KYG78696.1 hypothetical protein MB14_18405 [Roseivirga ehrenbergii]TCL10322.1 substrate-binding family protein [Roseivirga ehrenbergii]
MQEISVGVLIPVSTIYPIGKNFQRGLKMGFKTMGGEADIQLFPEFIGQCSVKNMEDAIDKLKSFHDVDFITGWASNMVLTMVGEKLKGNVPCLINNLGGHLPNPTRIPENIKINSTNLWQQTWSIGHWAVNKFGKKGMMIGSLYDMGYAFPQMLDLGMSAANSNREYSFAVCPMPEHGQLSEVNRVLDEVEKVAPDFLFAAFCGAESKVFLDAFIKRGLQTKIPLLGSPYLLGEFSDEADLPIKWYSTLQSYTELSDEDLKKEWTISQGIFQQLGIETAECVLKEFGLKNELNLLRGNHDMTVGNAGESSRIFITENLFKGNEAGLERRILQEEETIDFKNNEFLKVANESSSNWLNPYLGI